MGGSSGLVEVECANCGKIVYRSSKHKLYFCCVPCRIEYNRNLRESGYTFTKISKICKNCGKEYFVVPSLKKRSNYCSKECYKAHGSVRVVCDACGKEFTKTKSQAKSKRHYCCTICMGIGQSKYRLGEDSANWRGGISTEHDKIRKIEGLKEWRIAVFTRDNYTCQHCGKRGGDLNAHHIKRFRDFPELRAELSNGITLCVDCHKVETRKELLADGDFYKRMLEAKAIKKANKESINEGGD